jgi:hypothetical protein
MRLRKILCAGLIVGSTTTAMVVTTGGPAGALVTQCDQINANIDYAMNMDLYFNGLGYYDIAAAWYEIAYADIQYRFAYC